ncbi:LysR family transcriptional regulator [Paenibacillus thalictri]|uniref:LysR family transcriptional regulator n=1 Tax=Paenibacillus thalictri TaxID=2527873 RepID=UPI003B82E606
MTLQQLKYILTIVSCGSISEAAKRLFISQPSLSNAVIPKRKACQINILMGKDKIVR